MAESGWLAGPLHALLDTHTAHGHGLTDIADVDGTHWHMLDCVCNHRDVSLWRPLMKRENTY